jgi:hypothetical protein
VKKWLWLIKIQKNQHFNQGNTMKQQMTILKIKCDVCGEDLSKFYSTQFIYTVEYQYFNNEKDNIHLCSSCAIAALKEHEEIVDENLLEILKKKNGYYRKDIMPV